MITNNLILNFGMMIRISMNLMRSGSFKYIIKHFVYVDLSTSATIMLMLMCVKTVALATLRFSADFLRILLFRAIRISYAGLSKFFILPFINLFKICFWSEFWANLNRWVRNSIWMKKKESSLLLEGSRGVLHLNIGLQGGSSIWFGHLND